MNLRDELIEASGLPGALIQASSYAMSPEVTTPWLEEEVWSDPCEDLGEVPSVEGPITGDQLMFRLCSMRLPKLDTPELVESWTVAALVNCPHAVEASTVDEAVRKLAEAKFWGPFLLVTSSQVGEVHHSMVLRCVRSRYVPADLMMVVQVTEDVVRMIFMGDRVVPQIRSPTGGRAGVALVWTPKT